MEERQASELEWTRARQMTALQSAEQLLEDDRQPVRQLPERQQDAARLAKVPQDESGSLRPESLEELRQVSRWQARPTRALGCLS